MNDKNLEKKIEELELLCEELLAIIDFLRIILEGKGGGNNEVA